jgi:hypothetical protein
MSKKKFKKKKEINVKLKNTWVLNETRPVRKRKNPPGYLRLKSLYSGGRVLRNARSYQKVQVDSAPLDFECARVQL